MTEIKDRILIKDLKEHIGKDVKIAGWVSTVRDHGKVAFIVPRDRSGTVQAVASSDYNDTALPESQKLREQWVVEIVGEVKERPEKMRKDELNGELELGIKEVKVLSKAAELPFDMDAELNQDTYLDNLPLTLRRDKARKVFALQATILKAFRQTLADNDFTEFQSPAIVGGDAEGGADVFKLEYFKDNVAYLASSPQLYKQMMTGVFERVYTTPKVFRAEKSATTRHLSEYTTLDFEMAFIQDHRDVMNMLTKVIHSIVSAVDVEHSATLRDFGVEIPLVPEQIPFMKLSEAQEIIKRETGEDCVGEPDLEPAHERFLCEYAVREHGSDFIFITHYPVSKRPFYTMEDESDQGFTKSFDLLFRGVEIVSGGQRVHDYNMLIEKIKDKGLNPEAFEFYLQAFKYGLAPHGGIGMGLERLTEKFLGTGNVREASLFPRDMNRIDTLLSKEPSKS
jgi:nondiscriminating aspartyl-tRNA synthetase